MPHELFYFWVLKFQTGANRLRIKFCTSNSYSFFSKVGAWYLQKQPNLKKWSEIEKKRPLAPIAAKLGISGKKLFWLEHAPELWDCNRVGQILIL